MAGVCGAQYDARSWLAHFFPLLRLAEISALLSSQKCRKCNFLGGEISCRTSPVFARNRSEERNSQAVISGLRMRLKSGAKRVWLCLLRELEFALNWRTQSSKLKQRTSSLRFAASEFATRKQKARKNCKLPKVKNVFRFSNEAQKRLALLLF